MQNSRLAMRNSRLALETMTDDRTVEPLSTELIDACVQEGLAILSRDSIFTEVRRHWQAQLLGVLVARGEQVHDRHELARLRCECAEMATECDALKGQLAIATSNLELMANVNRQLMLEIADARIEKSQERQAVMAAQREPDREFDVADFAARAVTEWTDDLSPASNLSRHDVTALETIIAVGIDTARGRL